MSGAVFFTAVLYVGDRDGMIAPVSNRVIVPHSGHDIETLDHGHG